MRHLLCSLPLVAAIVASLPSPAAAETPLGVTSLAEAKMLYQHDVQACNSGTVDEDRRTCLLEARRAYDEARHEVLSRQQHHKSSQRGKNPAESTDDKAAAK
jgi:hypothetical protein